MTDPSRVSSAPPRDIYEDEISVNEWLRKFREQRRLFVGAAIAGVVTAAVIAYASPPVRIATAQLIAEQQSATESTSVVMASYRQSLESLAAAEHVVGELGLAKASTPISAQELRPQVAVTTADAAGIVTIEVRSHDADLAASVATSLTRYGIESARRAAERSRIRTNLGMILQLKQQLPELLAEIQSEETGIQVIQEQLRQDSVRREGIQQELVLARVRLAQHKAKWDHIVSGINAAVELTASLEREPPDTELPEEIVSAYQALAGRFGVAAGESRSAQSPLRLLSPPALAEPAGLRQLATNLVLGFVFGLLLAIAISVVLYVVSAGPKPAIPRPTPE